MFESFNVTSIGYSHVKSGKPCQDFSSSYSSDKCTIITACDGHGGDLYIRSHKGSEFASIATLHTMLNPDLLSFNKHTNEEIEHNLKLNILCEWNKLVQEDLQKYPIRKSKTINLSQAQIDSLKQTPIKAYGTTLGGAMLYGNHLICVGLGDGGCYLLQNGNLISAFPEDEDEPVANITYSLCSENAFKHMKARIFDIRSYDGVILCTDGVLAPYHNVENFKRSFVNPVVTHLLSGKTNDVKQFICKLGTQSGVGDDVSLSMILKTNTKPKYYK